MAQTWQREGAGLSPPSSAGDADPADRAPEQQVPVHKGGPLPVMGEGTETRVGGGPGAQPRGSTQAPWLTAFVALSKNLSVLFGASKSPGYNGANVKRK